MKSLSGKVVVDVAVNRGLGVSSDALLMLGIEPSHWRSGNRLLLCSSLETGDSHLVVSYFGTTRQHSLPDLMYDLVVQTCPHMRSLRSALLHLGLEWF